MLTGWQFAQQLVGYDQYACVEPIVSFVTGDMMIVDEFVEGKSRASIDDVVALFTTLLERQRQSGIAALQEDYRQFFGGEREPAELQQAP